MEAGQLARAERNAGEVRHPGDKRTEHRKSDKPFQNSDTVVNEESTAEAEPHHGQEECLGGRRESHSAIISRRRPGRAPRAGMNPPIGGPLIWICVPLLPA